MAHPAIGRRLLLVALPVAALAAAAAAGQERSSASITVQLLAINDFHGNLEPPTGSNGLIDRTPAGGAEYLATHLKNAIARNPNSIIVAAGDLIGASPLVSALFHDEPTIESLNAMNLAVSSVGNHEFDRGQDELRRMHFLPVVTPTPVSGTQDSRLEVGELRDRIDAVDSSLAELLQDRTRLAIAIQHLRDPDANSHDVRREEDLLARAGTSDGPMTSAELQTVFGSILRASRSAQRRTSREQAAR